MTVKLYNGRRDEADLTMHLAKRAAALFGNDATLHYAMDITAVHLNDCRLDLEGLSNADDFNFAHDIDGIYQNLDRETGKLKNCFRPRFALNGADGA